MKLKDSEGNEWEALTGEYNPCDCLMVRKVKPQMPEILPGDKIINEAGEWGVVFRFFNVRHLQVWNQQGYAVNWGHKLIDQIHRNGQKIWQRN